MTGVQMEGYVKNFRKIEDFKQQHGNDNVEEIGSCRRYHNYYSTLVALTE